MPQAFASFEAYMHAVDAELGKRCGLGHRDLADYMYRDAYDDEVPPAEVAEEVLADNGYSFPE